MEILKQPQYSPYSMEEQVVILFLGVGGHLMDVAVAKVSAFVRDFTAYLKIHNADLLEAIAKTGETTAELEGQLSDAIEDFKNTQQGKK
jgi:F0F1-type ATP synthase alpha subunit